MKTDLGKLPAVSSPPHAHLNLNISALPSPTRPRFRTFAPSHHFNPFTPSPLHPFTPRYRPAAFALVATLLMIAAITGAAVAFFQSMRVERYATRNYAEVARARLAAQSGLAHAMALIRNGVPDDLKYFVTQSANAEETSLQAFTTDANGAVSLSGNPTRLVSPTNGTTASSNIPVLIDPVAGIRRTLPTVETPNPTDATRRTRYAFWVDDNSSCFNPVLSGNQARQTPLVFGSLPLPYRTGQGDQNFALQPAAAAQNWSTNVVYRSITNTRTTPRLVFSNLVWSVASPRSLNLAATSPGLPYGDYDFATESFSDVASPAGNPKVNLRVLKAYVDTLSQNQGANNPKAQLVNNLLNNTNTTWATVVTSNNTGATTNALGGNFRYLLSRYQPAEASQFIACLIDYLDADRIPTTDNADNPTYFGVECWPTGPTPFTRVAGHPMPTYVVSGLVFNWSGAAGRVGGLNSTRVLAGVGLVNPWSEPFACTWGRDYGWDLNFEVDGSVTPTTWGASARQFFLTSLNEQLTNGTANIPAGQGTLMPFPINNNQNFANSNNLIPLSINRPLTFTGLQVRPTQLRLWYSTNNGVTRFVVAHLDFLRNQATTIPNVTSPGRSASTVAIFNRGGDFASIRDWHLRTDPRLGYLSTSWRLAASTATTDIPTPTDGVAATSTRNSFSDDAQGVPLTTAWFRSASLTNHFNGHLGKANANVFSIGELGYVFSGQPWRTINLTAAAPQNPSGQEDWRLLDMMTSGTLPEEVANSGFLTNTAVDPRGYFQRGLLNANSRKYGSWLAWLSGIPNLNASTTASAVAGLNNAAGLASSSVGGLFSAGWVPGNTEFARENVVRQLADGLTVTSRSFTVYAQGESLQDSRVVGRARLRCVVLVDKDIATGLPVLKILSSTFL